MPHTRLSLPPVNPPTFTLKQIKEAIPPHLFKRNMLTAFRYLAVDVVALYVLFFIARTFISNFNEHVQSVFGVSSSTSGLFGSFLVTSINCLLWVCYWYAAGCVMTGLWILAHECGHGAFTDYPLLNDCIGWVVHSFLLVPYNAWKFSHANHHKCTNSMEDDEPFVPYNKEQFKQKASIATDSRNSPIPTFLGILLMITGGWPSYLIANLGGPAKYIGKINDHFNPYSVLFRRSQFTEIVISDVGFFSWLGILGYLTYNYGISAVMCYYGIPLTIVNAHLVIFTYLQHSAPYIPHWAEREFTWLRGAISTVDRTWGPVLDSMFHHIADTHVCHHLFHELPFYNSQEATHYIKQVLGNYYLHDDTPVYQAFWNTFQECKYVVPYSKDKPNVMVYRGWPQIDSGDYYIQDH